MEKYTVRAFFARFLRSPTVIRVSKAPKWKKKRKSGLGASEYCSYAFFAVGSFEPYIFKKLEIARKFGLIKHA